MKRVARSRRVLVLLAVPVLVAVGLIVGIVLTETSPTAPPGAGSTMAFVRLANRGLGGTYEATYRLIGGSPGLPGSEWTVVVAHRGPSPSTNWMLDGGEWSFFIHAERGFSLQWIERGDRYEDCWRWNSKTNWVCGQGTTWASNGFILSTLNYVPGTVDGDIRCATEPSCYPVRYGVQRLTFSQVNSLRFGRLLCMTNTNSPPQQQKRAGPKGPFSISWCLTRWGLLASESQRGTVSPPVSPWPRIELISMRRAAPSTDFLLVSAPTVRAVLPPVG